MRTRYFTPFLVLASFSPLLGASALDEKEARMAKPLRYGNFAPESENLTFPEGVVLNVKAKPYGAKGDGQTDDTAAIQKALNDSTNPDNPKLVYVPNGTYMVSDTLRWAGRQTRTVLQGQSERGAIIKLRDRAFPDPATPKAVIWTGEFPPQRFRNAIRNLTIDSGKGNNGAIGCQFNASNQGILREVTIRSGDGAGCIGLDMGYTGDVGPLMVKNLTVDGFDVGIYTAHGTAAQTLEGVTLRGQKAYGWVNDGQAISVRGLWTKLSVPALFLKHSGGLTMLIDAEMAGEGAAKDVPAIIASADIFARNVKTSGYKMAIDGSRGSGRSETGPEVAEFSSKPPMMLFPSPGKSLNLPVRETPEVPWDDPATWVSVQKWAPKEVEVEDSSYQSNVKSLAEATKGSKPVKVKFWDWTDAIQSAIDSGATTIYFPPTPREKNYAIAGTIHVRGKVRRIIGLENSWANLYRGRQHGGGEWIIEDGAGPVTIERFDMSYASPLFRVNTKRDVVFASMLAARIEVAENANVFVEDACFTMRMKRGAHVWVRQFNSEYTDESRHFIGDDENKRPPNPGAPPESAGNVNDGGVLWVLGIKTEGAGTIISTLNGAQTEVLGALIYSNHTGMPDKKMFIVENASLSFGVKEQVSRGEPFHPLHETRDGVMKDFPPTPGGITVPLFVAYKGAPDASAGADEKQIPPGSGTGLSADYFDGDGFQKSKTKRLDPVIDFDWTAAGPDGAPAEARYSVRWSGFIEPTKTGVYEFPLSAENMRLLIGDTVVNSAWSPPVRYRNGAITLEAGKKYPIVLERRGVDKAKVALQWTPPGGPTETVPTTQLYPATSEPPSLTISTPQSDVTEGGSALIKLTRTGDTGAPLSVSFLPRVEVSAPMRMNFAGHGSAIVGRDYEAQPEPVTIPAGQSELTLTLKTIDNKIYEPQRDVIFEPAFCAAYRVASPGVKIWIKDNDAPPSGTGTGLKGEYFQHTDFTELKATRVDETVNFSPLRWDKRAPVQGIEVQPGYAVRWTGEIQPQFSETYTIKLDSSKYGAAKVIIGDRTIIDAAAKTDTPRSGVIALEAGRKYPITINYNVQTHYSSTAVLKWSSASQFEQVVPKTQLYPAP